MPIELNGPLTALDITRTPIEIFITKLNSLNSRQLSASEFVLSAPEVVAGDDPTLTQISLMPIVSSVFYNSVVLHYHRLNLADVLYFDSQLKSNDYSTLYQILPYLNSAYGVNLTMDDVYDDDIAYTQVGNLDSLGLVTVRAKPDSVLFFGEMVVRVNVISSEGANVNEDDRTYFALRVDDSTTSATGYSQIHLESNDILGNTPAEFLFFEGAQKLYSNQGAGKIVFWKTERNTFRLFGSEFVVMDPAVPAVKTTYRQIEIDGRGALVPSGCSASGPLFSNITDFVVDETLGFIYVLSSTYACAVDNLHVFDLQGTYLKSLKSIFPNFVGSDGSVESIAVDKYKHLIVMLKPISTTLQERMIVRVTPGHLIDTGFDTITLNTRNVSASVACIDDLLYLLINSRAPGTYPLAINGSPVMGSQPLGTISKLLFRFDVETGIPDDDFNTVPAVYGTAFSGTFSGLTLRAGTPHLMQLGTYLVAPAVTSLNPMGTSIPWFNIFKTDGTQLATTGQISYGPEFFQQSFAFVPVSAYEFLVGVGNGDGVTSWALLVSRSGVYSTSFFKGTKPGLIHYIATVSPDGNV